MNLFNNQQPMTNQYPMNNATNNVPMNYQQPQTPVQPYQPMMNNVPNWNRPTFTQQQMIPGRMINNPQEIRPNEVPMDGSIAFFPMNDYSYIYVKVWGADGNIQTARFVPERVEQAPQGPSEFEQVMARLAAIEEALGNRQNAKRNNRKNGNYQPPARVENNESEVSDHE